ncbi:MAG: hypothetical protein ACYC64_09455 [Armatimonadota bacterium]
MQYVNIAPLPGAGIALNSEGQPDGEGAMSINTPVAYTPGSDYWDLSATAGQFPNWKPSNDEWLNGTGALGLGIGRWPRLYVSAMAVSSLISNDSKAVSLQLQVTKESSSMPAFSVGVHDILDKEWADSKPTDNTGPGYYAVATKGFDLVRRPLYLSIGYGKGKFTDAVWGNASMSLNGALTVTTEYDGYQLNNALGWRPGGRYGGLTILGGYNGKCGPLVGMHYTSSIPLKWSVPMFLLLSLQSRL